MDLLVFNLTTSIIGAGIMALPATMKVLGLVLGFLLIIFMGIMSEISVEMLVRFSVLSKSSSYGEVVRHALGRKARLVSEICIIVNNAGVLVVYLIIMGDVMSGSPHHAGVFDQWLGNGFWDHRKLVILFNVVLFLAWLCALEKIDSLSLTTAASVALAVLFVLVAFAIAFVKLIEGKIEAPRLTPDFGSEKAILDLLVVIPSTTWDKCYSATQVEATQVGINVTLPSTLPINLENMHMFVYVSSCLNCKPNLD